MNQRAVFVMDNCKCDICWKQKSTRTYRNPNGGSDSQVCLDCNMTNLSETERKNSDWNKPHPSMISWLKEQGQKR